ncbi:MAG: hypothetical protein OXU81_21815 [Gammaproteobacteria bacterium]|nr:hypothetical protein [Gammaproteobacteria bacterium]
MTSLVHVAGFDPGLSGGAALVRHQSGRPPIILRTLRFRALDGPGGKRKVLDARGLVNWLGGDGPRIDVACIESVTAMPKQGVSTTFTFGAATGALEAIVLACSGAATVEWIRPATWKRQMKLGSDKHAAMDKAGLLFGAAAAKQHWPLRLDSGVAEAALLARWYCVFRLGHADT